MKQPTIRVMVPMEVKLPNRPNFLIPVGAGEGCRDMPGFPVQALSDSEIRRLGRAWVEQLVIEVRAKRSRDAETTNARRRRGLAEAA